MSLPAAPFTGQAAIDRALAISGDGYRGMCLKYVRTCYGVPAVEASARDAWRNARTRHPGDGTDTPAGYPVFWDITSGQNAPYDHVAISLGNGMCRSTSVTSAGIGNVRIADLTRSWGMRPYGWTEDINGYSVATGGGNSTEGGGSIMAALTEDEQRELLENTRNIIGYLYKGGPSVAAREGDPGSVFGRVIQIQDAVKK